MLKLMDKKYEKMKLTILGFNLSVNTSEMKNNEKILLFLSGPLTNLVVYLITGILGFDEVSLANFYLAFFNLLPIAPLDGGNVIKSILSKYLGKEKASKIMININYLFIIICIISIMSFTIIKVIFIFAAITGIKLEKDNLIEYRIYSTFVKYKGRKI